MQKPRSTSEAIFWLVLVLLSCVAAGAAASSLMWPLSWDEGIFAWIGGVVARGGTPYVDAWDVKGPVNYFGYALAHALFGNEAYGPRILDLLLTLAGTATVYRLLVPLIQKRAAALTALLLLISVLGQGYNVNGQPDLWVGWCLVFVAALVTVPTSAPRIAVGAMLLGVTVLMKPVYAAMGLMLIVPIVYTEGKNARSYAQYALAIAVGGAIPLALCAGWFWSRGALTEFWDAYIRFNVDSGASTRRSISGIVTPTVNFLKTHRAVLVSLPAVCIGILTTFKSSAITIPVWRTRVLAVWIFTLLALVVLQNRWFSYHWAPLYAPMAIAAGIGFARLLAWRRSAGSDRTARLIAYGFIALIAVGASLTPIRNTMRATKRAIGGMSTDEYLTAFDDYPGVLTARDVRLAAQYVKANTQPGEHVFVWEDPNVNVLSERPTSGRFAFWTPLLPSGIGPESPRYALNRTEFFRALETKPPVLLLMERAAWRGGKLNTIANVESRFPAFMHWIDQRYVQIDSAGTFLVFKPR